MLTSVEIEFPVPKTLFSDILPLNKTPSPELTPAPILKVPVCASFSPTFRLTLCLSSVGSGTIVTSSKKPSLLKSSWLLLILELENISCS